MGKGDRVRWHQAGLIAEPTSNYSITSRYANRRPLDEGQSNKLQFAALHMSPNGTKRRKSMLPFPRRLSGEKRNSRCLLQRQAARLHLIGPVLHFLHG